MTYEAKDPRVKLQDSSATTLVAVAEPQFVEFAAEEPAIVSDAGSRTWVARGQNFVVALTSLVAGDRLERGSGQEEYFLLVDDPSAVVNLSAPAGSVGANGRVVAIIPAGVSSITARDTTQVVRVFDSRTSDLAELASNASEYREPHPRVAPLESWPAPADESIRVYPLDAIPPTPGRFGRIFRSRTMMVNFMYPTEGPRDPKAMSPHHHDDFEQGSLTLAGDFDHHIRTPWSTDLTQWRDDQHRSVHSPSLAIIPPPTIHTTRATSPGSNVLIDIFSPPRVDFSAQPGWILNADEYPAPPHLHLAR